MTQPPNLPKFIRQFREFYRRFLPLCLAFIFSMSWVSSIKMSAAIARIPNGSALLYSQNNGIDLVDRANQLYRNGQLEDAAALLKESIAMFESQGDTLNQAIALANLSLVEQQQAQWEAAKISISRSLELLQLYHNNSENNSVILARSLDIQAQLQLAIGRSELALESWQRSSQIYTEHNQPGNALASQINRATAMQNLGLYPRACQTLLTALDIRDLESEPAIDIDLSRKWECALQPGELEALKKRFDRQFETGQIPEDLTIQIRGVRSLADVLRAVGTLEREKRNDITTDIEVDGSKELLDWLFELVKTIDYLPEERAAIALSLADTERALARRYRVRKIDTSEIENLVQNAKSHYQEAMNSPKQIHRVRAGVNALVLWVNFEEFDPDMTTEISTHWTELQTQFRQLPASQDSIYTQLHLVRQYFRTSQQRGDEANPYGFMREAEIEEILDRTERQAEIIGSDRAKAYVLGYRGQLQENRSQWENAERLTRQAIGLAMRDTANDAAPEINYRLFWQLGRIYKAQQQTERSISAYSQAFDALKSIRRDLIAIATESQFNFRDSVEPLYRQFVDLLLDRQSEPTVEKLQKARSAIEALQLAELDDYFQDACSEIQATNLDKIVDESTERTAVFYAILLSDRLEIILKLPNRNLQHYFTEIEDVRSFKNQIEEFYESASDEAAEGTRLQAYEIYQKLIKPVRDNLESSQIETLVFVLDGELRNIPMSALYDGKDYLIETYAIVLNPGLQLLPPESLNQTEYKTLTGGMKTPPEKIEGTGFDPLPNVGIELSVIRDRLSVVEELLDDRFTDLNLSEAVKNSNFSILHLATHGQFSSNPENTYIALYNNLLNTNEFSNLLRSSPQTIELLALSACQTAKGDNRAALGLAGIAVRSGAKATLATLWKVSDRSTRKFVSYFYTELKEHPEKSKAKVFQEAQKLTLNDYDDPYYWAPFVLIGNWF
ncbi:hypothetical protein AY599_20155 [Leptolyngbya valderiana BDU 20041]|nr:hypothetical protein AY599_20155 [Leptolyngbya valderiana BDU 20041]